MLYIFWFLHQTTTPPAWLLTCWQLYIFWFLHQTTTMYGTSSAKAKLYIFWFLHQTTTRSPKTQRLARLYIFWFLHQTTTLTASYSVIFSCISFDSYIKPQPWHRSWSRDTVVYLLIPTSNHNSVRLYTNGTKLYIFWFLHQTTTHDALIEIYLSCISFDSYIKPQLLNDCLPFLIVVYLLIPTSNHNAFLFKVDKLQLYIFWFLHQTTTRNWMCWNRIRLYIFWFLHQTTTIITLATFSFRCISFDSYIKPQPVRGFLTS